MGLLRGVYKLAGLALIQLGAGLMGLVAVILLLPFRKARYFMIARIMNLWGRLCCAVLNIRIHREGPAETAPRSALIVSNHIGSADIFIIAACFNTFFVTKSDVRSWPVIGPLTQLGSTIFIDRTQRTQVSAMVRDLTGRLRSGFPVALFPEGGATLGHRVEPFKSSAFESVVQAGGAVVPVMIRFEDGGNPSVACWPVGMTFREHMTNIMRHPRLDVRVCVLPAVEGEPDRRAFAEKSWKLISDKFEETRNAAGE